MGANPELTSLTNIDSKDEESVLTLCARWSHSAILEYLLAEHKWSSKEVRIALKETPDKNSACFKVLSSHAKKQNGGCFAMFCATKTR